MREVDVPRWYADTPDGVVGWALGLSGDPAAVARVSDFLADPFAGPLDVTPTGPQVARSASEELAVFAAIMEIYGRAAHLAGDVPDLTFGAPPDAVF